MGNWFTDALDSTTGFLNKWSGVNASRELAKDSFESFMAAYNYVYSNYISQPVSTLLLQTQRKDEGDFFKASEWSRAWRAAEHVSAGQATAIAMQPWRTNLAEEVINSELIYYEPKASLLPTEFHEMTEEQQQEVLKEAGMPAIGNKRIEQERSDSDFFKWTSGGYDFTARWFADPLIAGGKGLAAIRRGTVAKRRPSGGWSQSQIDKIVASSKFSQLVDFLEANRANPMLVSNLDQAIKTIGPQFGAINSLLKSREETVLFLRTGMGDVRAQQQLMAQNALVEQRLMSGKSRLSTMDMDYARYASTMDPRLKALYEGERVRLERAISADEAMVARYEEIVGRYDDTGKLVTPGIADQIDQIFLSRWSFVRAQQRTESQLQYLTGPARGGGLSLRRTPGAASPKGPAARQAVFTATPVLAKIDPATGMGVTRAVETGFHATRLWGIGDFFTTPVTAVRMMKNAHPTGYLALDNAAFAEQANINELRGQLARIPGVRQQTRLDILNKYLRTTSEAERVKLLDEVSNLAVQRIARRHGLPAAAGKEIWEAQKLRVTQVLDDESMFTAAAMPREGAPPLRVDHFGPEGAVKVHPHTVSRIRNSYLLPDLDAYNRVLARHSSALSAIRLNRAGNPDWIKDAGDYLNYLWKFSVLFRLGYLPRVLGDDIASQWAALGTAAMAMRVGYGTKNLVTNLVHRATKPFNAMDEKIHLAAVAHADDELRLVQGDMARLQAEATRPGGRIHAEKVAHERALLAAENRLGKAEAKLDQLPPQASEATRGALQRFVAARQEKLAELRSRGAWGREAGLRVRLRDMELQEATLQHYRELAQRAAMDAGNKQRVVRMGDEPLVYKGVTYPGAFTGQRGEYAKQRISPDKAYDQLFKTPKQLVHANLIRSFDNGARPINAVDNAVKHATAWAHAINAQIAGDVAQRMLIAGRTEAQVVHWLKNTGPGRAYWNRLKLQMITPEELVARWRYEVDEYLPLPEIRMQALTPEGVTPEFLKSAMPLAEMRPVVHMANVGRAPLNHIRAMDRVMAYWYNTAVTIPAKTLSRHPLYAQLYEGHLKGIVNQRAVFGAQTRTVGEVEHAVEAARRLAERDMKRLVFDIAHSSDAASALRWISPFFSATAESFQRWGRVIADKPQVVGYAAMFYNAPASLGAMQDSEGNRIFADGTIIDPTTGKRKLVSKRDRYIVKRMPKWFVDSPLGTAFGVESTSREMVLSQNSMNIVTQGDPWFSPGVGPIVQIPVNELVKDKPDQAELARHLGILPFGPATDPNPFVRVGKQSAPGTVRQFLTAWDSTDYRYQQVKSQIMQRAIFEHEEHGKPMPSAAKINEMTRNYWLFSAASAFLQPMATKRKDPYQFFRDQFNAIRAKHGTDTTKADIEFLDRFGEEYFIFATTASKNTAGLSASKAAVEASKKYADILAAFPELGPLIVGPEGRGPFSPEAYAYQLTTPLVPGGAEMQRRRLSAEEALKENQRREGWAKFTAFMNHLTAEAVKRGATSVEEVEELALMKRAYVMLLSEPKRPDGKENRDYNPVWTEDYFSFNSKKYDLLIPQLERVAMDVLAKDPNRGDMRGVLQYLQGREAITHLLSQRKFRTLGAESNRDLRGAWTAFVGRLIEEDTTFGDLHHRYLSRDLGVDTTEALVLAGKEPV